MAWAEASALLSIGLYWLTKKRRHTNLLLTYFTLPFSTSNLYPYSPTLAISFSSHHFIPLSILPLPSHQSPWTKYGHKSIIKAAGQHHRANDNGGNPSFLFSLLCFVFSPLFFSLISLHFSSSLFLFHLHVSPPLLSSPHFRNPCARWYLANC